MSKQYLAIGQKITYVGADGAPHEATITWVYSDDAAKVEWDGGSAIADVSDEAKPGTFHFGDASTKAEKTTSEAN